MSRIVKTETICRNRLSVLDCLSFHLSFHPSHRPSLPLECQSVSPIWLLTCLLKLHCVVTLICIFSLEVSNKGLNCIFFLDTCVLYSIWMSELLLDTLFNHHVTLSLVLSYTCWIVTTHVVLQGRGATSVRACAQSCTCVFHCEPVQ